MRLRLLTDPKWTAAVLSDLDAFLLDHAACERKASAMALRFLVAYPDRKELVREMVALAQEELAHFAQVYAVIEARGLILTPDTKDPYVNRLLALARRGTERYLMDRLLIAGIIEGRGAERFGLLAEALPAEGPLGALKELYRELTRSEARHHGLFLRLARRYHEPRECELRLEELLEAEAALIAALPHRAALH